MGKNIVICLDGTGNEIEENISNVLKIYRAVKRRAEPRHGRPAQIVYYAQGVGTLAEVRLWSRFRQWFTDSFLGKTFGYGIDERVQDAYRYLVRNWEKGDQVFIFGYSRGAYTARVLAGMLHTVGMLRPDQINLTGAAYGAYLSEPHGKRVTPEDEDTRAETFRRVTGTRSRNCPVRFLGLFDTVGSVLVPNFGEDPKWFFTRDPYPHTFFNPSVERVRHAVSVDERRQMFPVSLWPDGQDYMRSHRSQPPHERQALEEVWFAGAHGDIGGGNPRAESGLSQIPLGWMFAGAEAAGMEVNTRMRDYVCGLKPYTPNTTHLYPAPDPAARLHPSLKRGWWLFEWWPTRAPKTKPTPGARTRWHFPLGRPRPIPAGASVHPTVYERMERVADYRPANVPGREV